MPKYNYRKGDAFFAVDRFSGIDLRVRGGADPGAARKCVNYRFSPSGGLVPRCGFSPRASFGSNIRGLISCRLGGNDRLLAAVSDKLYRIRTTTPAVVGTLARSSGNIVSFMLDGKLYIIDGTAIYSYDGTTFRSAAVYIPMRFSANGDSFVEREKYNALTDLIRVRFPTTTSLRTYRLPEGITDVFSAVGRDGTSLGDFTVNITASGKTISFDNTLPETTCELVCRTAESSAAYGQYASVISSDDAQVFGRVTTPKIYLFSSVNKAQLRYSENPSKIYRPYSGESSEIYFPPDNCFTVGDGAEKVTSACRFLNRLFIFTEKDAWYVDTENPEEASPLHSNVGSVIRGGAISADNNPVTVGRDGLYLWKRITGYSECSAEPVSEAISAELTPDIISSSVAAYIAGRDEIWLCPSLAKGGGAYIWNYRRDMFYKFSGFTCDFITEYAGDAVFASGSKVFAFSESNSSDNNGTSDSVIHSEWENGYCPFNGYPEQKKLRRASFTAIPSGGEVSLTVTADNGRTFSESDGGRIALTGSTDLPLTFMYLAEIGSFYNAKIKLCSEGGRSEINSVSLGIEIV